MVAYKMVASSITIFIHLLLFLAADSTADDGTVPLVSFRELLELKLEGGVLRAASGIIKDELNPGGFYVANSGSIARIHPNLTLDVPLGRENETYYLPGYGVDVYFSTVVSLESINSGETLLVADLGNKCIRSVNLTNHYVDTFAGRCAETRSGIQEGWTNAKEFFLKRPTDLIYWEKDNLLYYLLMDDAWIVVHNISSDMVEIKWRRQPRESIYVNKFVLDSTGEYLYVTHDNGLSKINTQTWERTLVAGNSSVNEFVDGPLLDATFTGLFDIAWLIPDQVLIGTQPTANMLRVINLVDDEVTSICQGGSQAGKIFVEGDMDRCQVNIPDSVNVIDGIIYIGERSGYSRSTFRGHIVMLEYDQIMCVPPVIDPDWGVAFSPIQNRYLHNQQIHFSCKTAEEAIQTEYSVLKCTKRMRHANGTIYGDWDETIPTCRERRWDSMEPTQGQKSGGTTVTLSGTFPSHTRISVQSLDGSIRQSMNPNTLGNTEITIKMSPQGNFSTIVHVILYLNDTDEETGYHEIGRKNYSYIADPVTKAQSRNDSIARGGVMVTFNLSFGESGYNYTLSFYRDKDIIASVGCNISSTRSSISCMTPDLSYLFNEDRVARRRRKVFLEDGIELETRLLSDGLVIERAPFSVIDSNPEFYSLVNTRYDIATMTQLTISGAKLNTGLMAEDYQVTIERDDGSSHSCDVSSDLSTTKLHCTPHVDFINQIREENSPLTGTIKVSVANESHVVGTVQFYQKAVPAPDDGLKAWEIAVIVAAAMLSLIIIGGCIVYFKLCNKPPPATLILPGAHITVPVEGDPELWIGPDLRVRIQDLKIDPNRLSYNPQSEPLGKGHFGHVYSGQLQLKGNILKTVAVKTLKETQDIDLEKLEGFLEEATFTKHLQHVNILSTIGIVWREKDRPLVVLPYMARGDLHSLLTKSELKFTNGDLVHFGVQIATGMEYLMKERSLHRDLAARNCLVSEKFLVKIADFGMSQDVYEKDYVRDTESTQPKPAKWMALESLTEGLYNEKSEVWSFGVLMWELFTRGNSPYPGLESNLKAIITHLKSGGRLHCPQHVHPLIYEALSNCWLEDPEKRPTFKDLIAFLQVVLESDKGSLKTPKTRVHLDETEHQYSYVREHTVDIPHDYAECYDDAEGNGYSYEFSNDIVYFDSGISESEEYVKSIPSYSPKAVPDTTQKSIISDYVFDAQHVEPE